MSHSVLVFCLGSTYGPSRNQFFSPNHSQLYSRVSVCADGPRYRPNISKSGRVDVVSETVVPVRFFDSPQKSLKKYTIASASSSNKAIDVLSFIIDELEVASRRTAGP